MNNIKYPLNIYVVWHPNFEAGKKLRKNCILHFVEIIKIPYQEVLIFQSIFDMQN